MVDVVPAVLDGDDAAFFQMGNDGNGFAAVASKRKQKRVQFFVVRDDVPDDILFSFLSMDEIHVGSAFRWWLVNSNS